MCVINGHLAFTCGCSPVDKLLSVGAERELDVETLLARQLGGGALCGS